MQLNPKNHKRTVKYFYTPILTHRMPHFANPLIYVVDDDHDEHFLISTVFANQQHFRLKYFSHGRELLTQLTHRLDGQLPDLILLDLHMPILNGFEVLQLLKNDEDWRSIPVAVRTASAGHVDISRCFDMGIGTILLKTRHFQPLTNLVKTLFHPASTAETELA